MAIDAENGYSVPSGKQVAMSRLRELDALRGLASVSVVLLHFHDMWTDKLIFHPAIWQSRLLLLLSPVQAGSEAVVLFFLLSGLVLAIPYEKGKPQSYGVFMVRRITRIYGPYLVALAVAVWGSVIWHGDLHHGPWAAHAWRVAPDLSSVLAHLAFLGVYESSRYNVVFWSLIQEMRISLIFPLVWLFTRKLGLWSLAFAACGSVVAVVASQHPDHPALWSFAQTAHYAGFFMVGILIARHLEELHRRLSKTSNLGIAAAMSFLCYFAGMGLFADRILLHHFAEKTTVILGSWIVLAGAAGFIVLGTGVPAASRMLTSRLPLFLGRISYSLYLVHFAILMALTFAAGTMSAWIQLPIFLVLSFGLATVFCLFVEEPFMRWGRDLTSPPATRKPILAGSQGA